MKPALFNENIVVDIDREFQMDLDDTQIDIERHWDEFRSLKGGGLFNGKLLHVIDINATPKAIFIRVGWTDYKTWSYFRSGLKSGADVAIRANRIRPLAVSGLTLIRSSQSLLFGVRSGDVTQFPGCFELVPSGSVDDSCFDGDRVDYLGNLKNEFTEETGVDVDEIACITPFGVFEDDAEPVVDIAIRIEIGELDVEACRTGEYSRFEVVPISKLDEFVRRNGGRIVPTSKMILANVDLNRP